MRRILLQVIVILNYYLADELEANMVICMWATEDGSEGTKGNVMNAIAGII